MTYFYRNTGGDELLFIHRGSGVLETQLGELAYRDHDYLVVPTGTTYRVTPSTPTRLLVYECSGAVTIPRKYRNDFGQLEEQAPYYERDFRVPVLKAPVAEQGEYEVRVTSRGRDAVYVVQNHPCDVVGWDGYCYPYAFNLEEFMPITGKLHQPPPAHATFDAPGAAFCAFVPRMFDYHPLADSGAVQPFQRRLRRGALLRERQLHEPARRRRRIDHTARRGRAARAAARRGGIEPREDLDRRDRDHDRYVPAAPTAQMPRCNARIRNTSVPGSKSRRRLASTSSG